MEETHAGGVFNVNFHWATGGSATGGLGHEGEGDGMINVNFRWATGGSGHGGDPYWGAA